MNVVELAPDRIADAVHLWERTNLTRPWNDPVLDARRALNSPTSTILALMEDSHVIATAMVGHDGHRGWLYYVAVDPERQGQGIGRQLVQECTQWLQTMGVPKVQLMVRNENRAVIDFYTGLGFEDQNVVVLGKRL